MKKSRTNIRATILCLSIFFASQYAVTRVIAQNPSGEGDTAQVNTLLRQSKEQLQNDPSSTIRLATQARDLADKIGFSSGKAYALKNIGLGYYFQGKYPETLEYWNASLEIFRELKDDIGIANLLNNIAAIYINNGDNAHALEYSLESLKLSEQAGDTLRILSALNSIGSIYFNKETTLDKALDYFLKALPLSEKLDDNEISVVILGNIGEIYFKIGDDAKALTFYNKAIATAGDAGNNIFPNNGLGKLYLRKGDFEQALNYHQTALASAEKQGIKLEIVHSLQGIANVYKKENNTRPALLYFNKAVAMAEELRAMPELKELYEEMASTYSSAGEYSKAFTYQSLYSRIKDTIYNIETDKKLGSLQFEFDLQKKQSQINLLALDKTLQQAKLKKQKDFRNGLLIGLGLVLIIAVIQWRHSVQRKKANTILQIQKKETEQQKEKAERVLEELKLTQSQLIQSEKMASLGELTAGIAHEIQNPLNFVNNFSEVNKELLEEMTEEIGKGNFEEVKVIAKDVIDNEEKINHHGKRADAIVKGMLQHSRSSNGQKEPTDINALAEEYLRLAYHGLRAKDKSFDATTKTNLDETIGRIKIIPQDIGRVILNLINNAFYAVNEKNASTLRQAQGSAGQLYTPTVSISTKKIGNKVEVRVKDNGNGIPQKIVDKIFQPFFTTKPTGQGTGLGLSMSYDIVKAHGGEIKVESKENEGTEFSIVLPL